MKNHFTILLLVAVLVALVFTFVIPPIHAGDCFNVPQQVQYVGPAYSNQDEFTLFQYGLAAMMLPGDIDREWFKTNEYQLCAVKPLPGIATWLVRMQH